MKKALRFLLILIFLPGMLFAAEPYYDKGSQIFSITAGVTVPMMYYNPHAENTPDLTFFPGSEENTTRHTVGGIGAIAYQVFLNPYFAIGGHLGFQFDFSVSGTVATYVPIYVKATYVPLQGRFEIPISLGAGLLYTSFNDFSKLTFGCELEVGARYFITDEWGLGLNASFHVIPEIYTSEKTKISTMMFMPITLSVSYRH